MNEEAIFAAALNKKTAADRKAFLDQACAGNIELRGQVEELLRADSDAGSFLDHPPLPIDATVASGETARHSADSDAWISRLTFLQPCSTPGRLGKLSGKVGEYEIIEIVGHGGMGAVLRAFDTKLSRVVAVKVMAPELAANPVAVRRFLREATSAAAIHHDHVVTIHAVDDSHQPPYLVMQFVEGQTLQQKIDDEGALELKQILRIGSQAAAGLAAAHKTGLIHRDVKPSNILLENGVQRVKISDFGLARAADDLQVTQTGIIAGTPQYMSPEQAKGEPIDAKSDLFSLGSVLYTMCTGRSAFRADNPIAVLRRVIDDTPRSIHELNPDIPSWLEAIVSKLLAKNPADRFQTASEVAELLGQHLAHVQNPSLAPLPAPVAFIGTKFSPPSASVTQATRPSVPLWVWSGGLVFALVAMFGVILKELSLISGRALGLSLVILIFSWLVALSVWILANHRNLTRATREYEIPSKPRKLTARGVLVEHPVLGCLAVIMLMISMALASYLLTSASNHRVMRQLTDRRAPIAVEGPKSPFSKYVPLESTTPWTPPEKPDPARILNEARIDTQARHYESALEKLDWYHQNALAYQPAQSTVRLTSAMQLWAKLADTYSPAAEKLKAIRDQAELEVKEGQNIHDSFKDLVAINGALHNESTTKDLFEWLHNQKPIVARRVFSLAQPALVRTKAYKLCNDYLDPEPSLQQMISVFHTSKKLAASNIPNYDGHVGEQVFVNRVTTLVALLVANNRNEEAHKIAQQANSEWPSAAFRSKLDDALKGRVPEPWPALFH